MLHESQVHDNSWFVTLTYADEFLPEFGSLRAEDVTAFFKSFRKEFGNGSVSYFYCGEYGPTTGRPHYHAVLFGPNLSDREYLGDRNGNPYWRSDSVGDHWKLGAHDFSVMSFGSAAYVSGYLQKKQRDVSENEYLRVHPERGDIVEVERVFARMSLRPAIGRRWIERYWRDVYPRDYVVVDGIEQRPPRYYDKWLSENQPEVWLQVQESRDKAMRERVQVRPEREVLRAKEAILRGRRKLFENRGKI